MKKFTPVGRRRSCTVLVALVVGILASLLTACEDLGGVDGFMEPPRGRCEGVWRTAQQQCLDENPCIGFACLFVLGQCNSAGDFALGSCCARHFTFQPDFERCMDTFGAEPT